MNQKEKVKERIDELKMGEEHNMPATKEMSFKSMLEQFYKKDFESITEPEQTTAPNHF